MTRDQFADTLIAIGKAEVKRQKAQDGVDEAVQKARDAGASWGQIGGQLGISRQAAYKRYEDD
jgi:hypothetical protein